MNIQDFQQKRIQGLYDFDHYEHENGSYIQVYSGLPVYYVLVTTIPEYKRQNFDDFNNLKAFLLTI